MLKMLKKWRISKNSQKNRVQRVHRDAAVRWFGSRKAVRRARKAGAKF